MHAQLPIVRCPAAMAQADADAFERLLRRMDDSELRGFAMTCEIYMMQRLANAAPKPDPIAP